MGKGDFKALGFASKLQMEQAQALVEQCSGFAGMQDLALRSAKASEGASVGFEEGFVALPIAMLPDAAAGPAGKLGRALMGAAAKWASGATALSASGFRTAGRPAGEAGGGEPCDDGDWPGDGGWGAAKPEQKKGPPRAPRKPIDEGQGSESLNAMVTALESSGFGDPELAKRIKQMQGKEGSRGSKPKR